MKLKTKTPLYFAGIGSRETPVEICDLMRGIASALGPRNWILRSGHALGADMAFEEGAISSCGTKEIYLPWAGFNKGYHNRNDAYITHCLPNHLDAIRIASETHPNWSACSSGAQLLHTRNIYQIAGMNLDTPVSMVICWTKDGNATGGTGQAIRLAQRESIPVFNLFKSEALDQLQDFVYETELKFAAST